MMLIHTFVWVIKSVKESTYKKIQVSHHTLFDFTIQNAHIIVSCGYEH